MAQAGGIANSLFDPEAERHVCQAGQSYTATPGTPVGGFDDGVRKFDNAVYSVPALKAEPARFGSSHIFATATSHNGYHPCKLRCGPCSISRGKTSRDKLFSRLKYGTVVPAEVAGSFSICANQVVDPADASYHQNALRFLSATAIDARVKPVSLVNELDQIRRDTIYNRLMCVVHYSEEERVAMIGQAAALLNSVPGAMALVASRLRVIGVGIEYEDDRAPRPGASAVGGAASAEGRKLGGDCEPNIIPGHVKPGGR